MMALLLRPTRGGGGGGSSDPPTGLEDKFRYHSHGVRAGSARRGTGECSQARRHSAMSDAHQRLRRATAELAGHVTARMVLRWRRVRRRAAGCPGWAGGSGGAELA